MKLSYFAKKIIFFSLFLPMLSNLQALIVRVTVLKNHNERKTVILLHDIHCAGTMKEKEAQLNKIKEECKKASPKQKFTFLLELPKGQLLEQLNKRSDVTRKAYEIIDKNSSEILERLYKSELEDLPSGIQETKLKEICVRELAKVKKTARPVQFTNTMLYMIPNYLRKINNITMQHIDNERRNTLQYYDTLFNLINFYNLQRYEPQKIASLIQEKLSLFTPQLTLQTFFNSLERHQKRINTIMEREQNDELTEIYKKYISDVETFISTYRKECKLFIDIPFFQLSKQYLFSAMHLQVEQIKTDLTRRGDGHLIKCMTKALLRDMKSLHATPLIEKLTPSQIVKTLTYLQSVQIPDGINNVSCARMLDLEVLHSISQSEPTNKICFYGGGIHCDNLIMDLKKLGYKVAHDSKLHDRYDNEYEDFMSWFNAAPLARKNIAPLPLQELEWLSAVPINSYSIYHA